MASEGKSGFVSQILIAVIVALVAGGSAPWWWGMVTHAKTTEQQAPSYAPAPSTTVRQTASHTPDPPDEEDVASASQGGNDDDCDCDVPSEQQAYSYRNAVQEYLNNPRDVAANCSALRNFAAKVVVYARLYPGTASAQALVNNALILARNYPQCFPD